MFEVGKKYLNRCTGSVVECLYLGQKRAFVRTSDGNEYNTPLWNDYYTEYKEPVKHVRYLLWYKSEDDDVYCGMYRNEGHRAADVKAYKNTGRTIIKLETVECIEE